MIIGCGVLVQAERKVHFSEAPPRNPRKSKIFAELAQLVERRLPKPQVTSSNLAFRSSRHLAAWQGAFFVTCRCPLYHVLRPNPPLFASCWDDAVSNAALEYCRDVNLKKICLSSSSENLIRTGHASLSLTTKRAWSRKSR